MRREEGQINRSFAMADKSIPNADGPFAMRAESFATTVFADPHRYFIEPWEAEFLMRRVKEFLVAYRQNANPGTRNAETAIVKKQARQEVEQLMRKLRNLIRCNYSIPDADKIGLCIKPRAEKLTKQKCPRRAPVLGFVGYANENSLTGRRHILRFKDNLGPGALPTTPALITNLPVHSRSRAKPRGAARLELFFEWVAEGQEVPKHPADLSGWPRFLRSFTRTPIEVEFPMPPTPMLIVYWARWCDSRGNVGPFSHAVVAGWEGRSQAPGLIAGGLPRLPQQQKVVITSQRMELPQEVEETEASDHAVALLKSA
jgi:hypothetical protein